MSSPARKRSSMMDSSSSYEVSSERLVVLRHTRAVVQKEVNKFLSAKYNPFNKYKYCVMVLTPFISVWMAGNWPSMYWRWHLCHIMIYLAICLFAPTALPEDIRGMLFRMVFAMASGPLGCSVILTQNSLVPQSMDQTALLLIHLQPLVTAHTLKYYGDVSIFPYSDDIDFLRYCIPSIIVVSAHTVIHTIFFLAFALHMPAKGHETAFNDLFTSTNIYTNILGEVGSGGPRIFGSQETLRFLATEIVSTIGIFGLIAATYPLYIAESSRIGLGIVFAIFFIAVFQGAQWTEYRVGRITSEIDELILMEESSMNSRGNDSYEDFDPPKTSATTIGHADRTTSQGSDALRSTASEGGYSSEGNNESMNTPFTS